MLSTLLRFRWLPFLAALVTLVALHFAIASFLDQNYLYFVQGRDDFRGRQSQLFAQEQQPHPPTAYFLGGSSMMWSLPEGDELKSAHESRRFRNYAYSEQTLIESYALLQKLPLLRGDVVLLHVSPSRIIRVKVEPQQHCRPYLYTITPTDIDLAYTSLGMDENANPLCYISFLSQAGLARLIITQHLLGRPPIRYISHIPQKFESSPASLNEIKKEILRRQLWEARERIRSRSLNINDELVEISLQLLEKIRAHVVSRGAHLILVDTPLNKQWYDHLDWSASNEQVYRHFGDRLLLAGFEYHDWRWDSRFDAGDFYDHTHVVQSGRDKILPMYQRIVSDQTR